MLNRRPMNRRPAHALLVLLCAAPLFGGCNESSIKAQQQAEGGPPIAGLNAQDAARILAKVGDRPITLGDYAKTLDRMDPFDRLRYQTKERRRELLNEMINVELLASEAKRRGLDKEPETEEAVRTILRDAMLAETRSDLPTPAEIPADEVRAFFEANGDKFSEPERRRVAAVVLGGTNVLGGSGRYVGTLIGVILIVLLNSVLSIMQMPEALRQIIYGVVIVVMLLIYGRGDRETV